MCKMYYEWPKGVSEIKHWCFSARVIRNILTAAIERARNDVANLSDAEFFYRIAVTSTVSRWEAFQHRSRLLFRGAVTVLLFRVILADRDDVARC